MILGIAFLSALIYGTSPHLVEQHVTIFSFTLIALVTVAMSGMMNCLVSTENTKSMTTK